MQKRIKHFALEYKKIVGNHTTAKMRLHKTHTVSTLGKNENNLEPVLQ